MKTGLLSLLLILLSACAHQTNTARKPAGLEQQFYEQQAASNGNTCTFIFKSYDHDGDRILVAETASDSSSDCFVTFTKSPERVCKISYMPMKVIPDRVGQIDCGDAGLYFLMQKDGRLYKGPETLIGTMRKRK